MSKSLLSLGKSSKRPTRKQTPKQATDTEPPTITKITPLDDDSRRAMIAEAAYYRAERRGFAPGFEWEDWLQSENEIDTQYQDMSNQASSTRGADLH